MKCCVSSCKMYSDRRSDEMIGVTFHSLPSEASIRQQWISKIGRRNWTPSKHTKICSCHFNKDDFFVTGKGFRKIRIGALPCLKLDATESNASNPDPDLDASATSKPLDEQNKSSYEQNQTIKIRTLQQKNRRLMKKNASLQQMVKNMKSDTNQDPVVEILHKRNLRLKEKNTSLIEIVKRLKKYVFLLKSRQSQLPCDSPVPATVDSVCRVCGTSMVHTDEVPIPT